MRRNSVLKRILGKEISCSDGMVELLLMFSEGMRSKLFKCLQAVEIVIN